MKSRSRAWGRDTRRPDLVYAVFVAIVITVGLAARAAGLLPLP